MVSLFSTALRHIHATILIEDGANIKDIKERLGPSGIKTTLQTYVHNTDAMKTATVDIFEKHKNFIDYITKKELDI